MAPDRPAGHRKTGNQPTQNASRPQSKAQTAKTGIKYTVFAGVHINNFIFTPRERPNTLSD
jgi:hypothetical protein